MNETITEEMHRLDNTPLTNPDRECTPQFYFIMARNMICDEHPQTANHIVMRIVHSIRLGGYLTMETTDTGFNLFLTHNDGTMDLVIWFRRRKRAVQFTAYIYLLALDKPGNAR